MIAFNSKEYTFCDTKVFALGREFFTLQGIEYKASKKKEVKKGSGGRNRSIQHGDYEYDGTITVLQSDLIALDRAAREAGYKSCLDLDFDFVVTYISATGIVTTDVIKSASITEKSKSLKQGDLSMECALPFIALDVMDNVI